MKTFITFLVLLGSLAVANAQTSHTLLATDFYYDPDTLYIAPGDTVDVMVVGYHSVTEIDSFDWANNVDNHNGGFDVGLGAVSTVNWFVVPNPGTYYYICGPHAAMGMKGIIIAQTALGIEAARNPQNFNVFQGADMVHLEYLDSDELVVLDLNGKQVYEAALDVTATKARLNVNLPRGVYLFRFAKEGHLRVTKKALLLN